MNASNWTPNGEPLDGGTVGGDGAGESRQVEYRNPELPNARITVDTYVVDRRERGEDHGDISTCPNCNQQVENEDGIWWHVESCEAFCEPDDPRLDRQAGPGSDFYPFDVETMTTFSILDANGEEAECASIEYAHPYPVSWPTEEIATERRNAEVARWQQWDYANAPIFTWNGESA